MLGLLLGLALLVAAVFWFQRQGHGQSGHSQNRHGQSGHRGYNKHGGHGGCH